MLLKGCQQDMHRALYIFLAATVLFFTACSKESISDSKGVVTGQLRYWKDPGNGNNIGFFLAVDSTHETLSLKNLPAEFKRTDVNERVAVRFFDTGQFETMSMLSSMSGPRIVVTLSIHKL